MALFLENNDFNFELSSQSLEEAYSNLIETASDLNEFNESILMEDFAIHLNSTSLNEAEKNIAEDTFIKKAIDKFKEFIEKAIARIQEFFTRFGKMIGRVLKAIKLHLSSGEKVAVPVLTINKMKEALKNINTGFKLVDNAKDTSAIHNGGKKLLQDTSRLISETSATWGKFDKVEAVGINVLTSMFDELNTVSVKNEKLKKELQSMQKESATLKNLYLSNRLTRKETKKRIDAIKQNIIFINTLCVMIKI